MIIRICKRENITDTTLMHCCINCKKCQLIYEQNFTVYDTKELRDITGAGMKECRTALIAAGGDIDKAVELLRIGSYAVYINCSDFERRD